MIEWAITSSVLILVVLALRRVLMGRISLRLQYGLWALVLVRLLLPVSLGGTSVSILNTVERTQAQLPNPVVGYLGSDTPQLSVVEPDPSLTVGEQQEHYQQNQDQWQAEMDAAGAEADTPIALGTVLLGIWAVGAASMGCTGRRTLQVPSRRRGSGPRRSCPLWFRMIRWIPSWP